MSKDQFNHFNPVNGAQPLPGGQPAWGGTLPQLTAAVPANHRVGASSTVNIKEMDYNSFAHQITPATESDIYHSDPPLLQDFAPQHDELNDLFAPEPQSMEVTAAKTLDSPAALRHCNALLPLPSYPGEGAEFPPLEGFSSEVSNGFLVGGSSSNGCPEQETLPTYPVNQTPASCTGEMNGGTVWDSNAAAVINNGFLHDNASYSPPVVAPSLPVPSDPSHGVVVPRKKGGKWSEEEHMRFLKGMKIYGKGKWKNIAMVVETRSATQVASHAQKFFERSKVPQEKKKRASINDRRDAHVAYSIKDETRQRFDDRS